MTLHSRSQVPSPCAGIVYRTKRRQAVRQAVRTQVPSPCAGIVHGPAGAAPETAESRPPSRRAGIVHPLLLAVVIAPEVVATTKPSRWHSPRRPAPTSRAIVVGRDHQAVALA